MFDVAPNIIHVLLDTHNLRNTALPSGCTLCIFDALFRIGLVKQLIPIEPNVIDDSSCLSINFTYIVGSIFNHTTTRSDVCNVIDWFVSPLRLLSRRDDIVDRKCCGCTTALQVPLSIPIFCLPLIRPLPVENILKLLADTLKTLVNDLYCSIEFSSENNITIEDKERLFQIMAIVQAVQKLKLRTNTYNEYFQISPDKLSLKKLISLATSYHHLYPEFCCIILRIIDILTYLLISNNDYKQYLFNHRDVLHGELLPLLISYSHQIRLHVLRILSVLNGDLIHSADCNNSYQNDEQSNSTVQNIIERCLKAEKIQLGHQTVRDFLMHILQLHADRDVKYCRQAAEIAIHYLFGLLHVQFTTIWSPLYEAIASYCEFNSLLKSKSTKHETTSSNELEIKKKNWSIECRNLFWNRFQPLLMDVERKIMDSNNKDIQNISDSNETNLYTCSYETAIIWFTSIRPDLYSLQRKTPNNDWLIIESRKHPDWLSYRLCLWQCLRWKTAAKYTHFLTPLLLNIINSAIQSGLNKSTEQLLLTILNLYSQFNNIKSIYMEKEFKQNIYQLLKFKQPTIQNAAFKCLLAYKQSAINNYKEEIEKIINPQTFRDAVRTFRLDTSLFSSEHREYIGGVFLRILYGRLQLSKGQFTSAVFTNLAQCTNSELNLFLSFLLDPFVKETECIELSTNTSNSTIVSLSDCIQSARQRVRHTIDGKDTLSWPRLHALSQIINETLNYMGHRLNIVSINENDDDPMDNSNNPIELSNNIQRADILLRLALSLLAMVYEVKQVKLESLKRSTTHHQHHHLPLTSQLKAVRLAAVNLLVHLFSSEWLCEIRFWGESTTADTITDHPPRDPDHHDPHPPQIDRSIIVKQICCNSLIFNDLLHSSTLSLNHFIIQLSYIWSSSTIFNGYLCMKFFDPTLLDTIFKLLNMHYNNITKTTNTTSINTSSKSSSTLKLKNEIIEKLVEIIYNLVFLPDVCTTGRVLIQSFHSELVNYLNKRLQELCHVKSTFFANLGKKPQSGLRLQREFQLVGYLAQLPYHSNNNIDQHNSTNCLTPADGERLLQALLQLLQRSSIRSLRNNALATKSASFKHRIANNVLVNSDESATRYDLQLATGEAVEAELIQSILHLVQITTNITVYLKKILDLFVCSKSRIARSLLCQVVGVCVSRLKNWPTNLIEIIHTVNNKDTINTTEEDHKEETNLRYFKKYLLDHNQSTDSLNHLTQNILLMLNSWDTTHIEQPDIIQRIHGFNLLIELCLLFKMNHPPEQFIYLHRAGLNCAIYALNNDELQLRDIALNYTNHCIQSIQSRLIKIQNSTTNNSNDTTYNNGSSSNNNGNGTTTTHSNDTTTNNDNSSIDKEKYYHELIIKCLWPNLINSLKDLTQTSNLKRLHLLRLLNSMIHTYQLRKRFLPLSLLLDNNIIQNDFYINLQSGTLLRQLCAIRRLSIFLHNPLTIISRRQLNLVTKHQNHHHHHTLATKKLFPISQHDLYHIFLPMIWFYLKPELNSSTYTYTTTDNHNNSSIMENHKKLIDYCLDAVEGLAKQFNWKYYRILLEYIMNQLNTCININLASQIMIRLIDAFQSPNWNYSINNNEGEDDKEPIEEQDGDSIMEEKVLSINNNKGDDDDDDDGDKEPIEEQEDHSMMKQKVPSKPLKLSKLNNNNDQNEQKEHLIILNYMLNVIKRLEPFIVKPIKINNNELMGHQKKDLNNQPLKISLVISLVMLLRRLPSGYLESRLPNLILRVIDILRPSRDISSDIRNEASKSLSRIGRLLGPSKGLDKLFEIVNQQLERGGYSFWQVRLYTLHRVLAEVEEAIKSGEVSFKCGQLDYIGNIMSRLYLDEIVGRLAEEMDSRRSAKLSDNNAKELSMNNLTGSMNTDLPEANGLKSPEGMTRLCRLLSADGIIHLFTEIKTALHCATSGTTLESTNNNSSSMNCGVRFRHKALARIECTLVRLPMKTGIFSNKFLQSNINIIYQLFQQLVIDNLHEITINNELNQSSTTTTTTTDNHDNSSSIVSGWCQPKSKLLEPRWKYLELDHDKSIIKSNSSIIINQSHLKQSHLLVCCGLYLFIGLIRYHWLKQTDHDHGDHNDPFNQINIINQFLPSIINCFNTKYIQIINITMKCIQLFLLITTSKSIINQLPEFSNYLIKINEKLFELLSINQSNSDLFNKIQSINYYTENFSKNLYYTLTLLLRHQYNNNTLTNQQLLTLINIIDIELNNHSTTNNSNEESIHSSLSLLHVIFQYRLNDPFIQQINHHDTNQEIDQKLSIINHTTNNSNSNTTTNITEVGSRLIQLYNQLKLLSITSKSDQIRMKSCYCLIKFLLNYSHSQKFLENFIKFCLKQLEYKKLPGRLSAYYLLYNLMNHTTIIRMITNQNNHHLDELILLNVATAIERESSQRLRQQLLNLFCLLFNQLSINKIQLYYENYIIAFLTAPPETRYSTRLLGLQIIQTMYNNQQSFITMKQYRNQLINIISNDIIPCGMIQLNRLVFSNVSLMMNTGLHELYNKRSLKTPKEEYIQNQIIKEDAKWMSEIELPKNAYDDDDVDDHDDDDDDDPKDASKLSKDFEKASSSDDDDDNEEEEEDIDFNDADFGDNMDLNYDEDPFTNADTFETIENNKHTNDTINNDTKQSQSTTSTRERKCSKSAMDNQYFIVAHTLEHALKLVYQMITKPKEDSTNTLDNNIDTYISSIKLSSFWRILINGPKYNDHLSCPITEFQSKKHRDALNKRREQYSTLFSIETTKTMPKNNTEGKPKKISLLIAGHRETREWATRCLNLLLKCEVMTNQDRFIKQTIELDYELSGLNVRSALFKKLQRNKSNLNKVLQRILTGLLFQLEVDARVPISEEWSNALLSNLIYLGQLLHLSVGRKPVLRIFRIANKIALDELNNRPQYYCQRLLALKLTTGLLLRLPHPNTTQLFDMFSLNTRPSSDSDNQLLDQSDENLSVKKQVPAYFAYLRSASKLISREFRQRERLAFTAASSLASAVNDDTTDMGARIRLRGMHLSKELTARAKSRRRRAQARLRRALMSGTIRPESANSLVASVSAGMAKAGPDQLVELIESTESALTQELGGGNHQLIQIICSRASLGARVIRERRKMHKVTRNALGVAWNGPVKKKSKLLDVASEPLEMNNFSADEVDTSNRLQKRKLSSDEASVERNQKATPHEKTKKPRISL
uniref:DRIM domain-containing protein n=1 Tax=Schistosoma mansoni TaxID=6183 RepID=A0A5K4F493_SCHMA